MVYEFYNFEHELMVVMFLDSEEKAFDLADSLGNISYILGRKLK